MTLDRQLKNVTKAGCSNEIFAIMILSYMGWSWDREDKIILFPWFYCK